MHGCSSKKSWGLLALRLVVGIVFIYHGWMKLQGMEMTTGMMASIGLPAPMFWAWLVALVEFVGGIALVLGLFTRLVIIPLIVTMIVALLTVHTKMPYGSVTELPIVLVGALIALGTMGGGKYALIRDGQECGSMCVPGESEKDVHGCCGGECGCGPEDEEKK